MLLQHNSYSSQVRLQQSSCSLQMLLQRSRYSSQKLLQHSSYSSQKLLQHSSYSSQMLLQHSSSYFSQMKLEHRSYSSRMLLSHISYFSQILHVPSKYCFLSDAASTRASFFFSYIELRVFLLLIHSCCCSIPFVGLHSLALLYFLHREHCSAPTQFNHFVGYIPFKIFTIGPASLV